MRAAEAMFMTQPAVTFQIKQLEEHYGVSLFERKSQPLRLVSVRFSGSSTISALAGIGRPVTLPLITL